MILILCVDDRGGMLFNRRRQSQDREVRRDILAMAAGRVLRMTPSSRRQFPERELPAVVEEDFLQRAGPGELCLVEDQPPGPWLPRAEQVILYRWNRVYPADLRADFPPPTGEWRLAECRDFPGHSHKTITKEVYCKC